MEKKLNNIISKIKVELQKSSIKKSGMNKHAGFSYYELSDFLPRLNELMNEHGINDHFSINSELASLTLWCGEESQTYTIPFQMFSVPVSKNNVPVMQQIQYLGALNTYFKRYLYINAFGITDGEIIDNLNNSEMTLSFTAEKFDEAVRYLKDGGNIDAIEKKYKIDEKTKSQLLDVVDNG